MDYMLIQLRALKKKRRHLYEVYNHYLHYPVFVSASTRTTDVSTTLFLQTWNGFEIDPS